MGTIDHIARPDRADLFAEVLRVLRPDGHLVISAWDPACPFQGFLSMYSPAEVSQLRAKLIAPGELTAEVAAAGLTDVTVTGFCLLPDRFALAMHQAAGSGGSVAAMVDLDERLQRADPGRPGQMFMVSARKL
jgi:SAM-dependent methyltransferase